MTHLEEWGTGKGAPACGADDSYDHKQAATLIDCGACQRWLIKRWKHWAHTNYLDKKTYDPAVPVTHYRSWGRGPHDVWGICLQRVEKGAAAGYAEFTSCAACQYALISGWAGKEIPHYRCQYCVGETRSWVGRPARCGHCKRTFRDDPEFAASTRNVINAIREHVLRHRDHYGPGSHSALDLDGVCSRLITRIDEEWQDEDRIYLPSEQQLDVRIDCIITRLVTALDKIRETLYRKLRLNMNETAFWQTKVRKVLHQPPTYVAWKIQDIYNAGLPDVTFIMDGHAGFLELKRNPEYPKRLSSRVVIAATMEQRRRLIEGRAAGGSVWLLLAVGEDWYLFDPISLEAQGWVVTLGDLLRGNCRWPTASVIHPEDDPKEKYEECPAVVVAGHLSDLLPLREFLLRFARR